MDMTCNCLTQCKAKPIVVAHLPKSELSWNKGVQFMESDLESRMALRGLGRGVDIFDMYGG